MSKYEHKGVKIEFSEAAASFSAIVKDIGIILHEVGRLGVTARTMRLSFQDAERLAMRHPHEPLVRSA